MYLLRFDIEKRNDPVLEELFEWFEKNTTFSFCVYENPRGDNPHVHAMIQSENSIRSLRNSFTYKFKKTFRDKRSYSITEKEGNVIYLCKGPLAISKLKDPKFPGERKDPDVVYNNNPSITEMDIARGHEEWWSSAKNLRIGKVEKEEKLSELDEMIKYIETKRCKTRIDGKLPIDYTEDDLIDDITDYYVKNRKTIRYSTMSEYVDTIWLILLNTYERKAEYLAHKQQVRQNLRNYRLKKY